MNNRPNVRYVISSTFDYEKLICADAGPAFAESYGWDCVKVHTLAEDSADIYVVDTRLNEQDQGYLAETMRDKRKIFFLRLTDPSIYFINSPWYKFIKSALERSNVRVMSTYTPSGVVALFFSQSIGARFIYAPYLYDARREVNISHAHRSRKLLISGSLDQRTYPVRFQIRRHARVPPLSLLAKTLVHPGYPDIGQQLHHNSIGANYIHRLSQYRFALVCSSNYRVELLKYTEIAYAGTAPVGDMPYSLDDCPDDAWVRWKGSALRLSRDLLTKDSEDMAVRYRSFIRKNRERARVQQEVEARMLSTL